jgi:hypothetical protein
VREQPLTTVRDRIIETLQEHPEGLDDDQLASLLGLKQRQQANARCRQLAAEELVERRAVAGKLRNFWVGGDPTAFRAASLDAELVPVQEPEPWFWEGNVQQAVKTYLVADGWRIEFEADTRSRQQGKDLEASRLSSGQRLLVSVKGFPKGTTRTNPATQARHWFSHALFDMALWRGEEPSVLLAVALPDFGTYRRLAERCAWFSKATPFSYFWVAEDRSVEARWAT